MPLTLHLLSPAHRPIQITRDLPGFWRGSWRGAARDAGPLSPPSLAGGSGPGGADDAGEAARDVNKALPLPHAEKLAQQARRSIDGM